MSERSEQGAWVQLELFDRALLVREGVIQPSGTQALPVPPPVPAAERGSVASAEVQELCDVKYFGSKNSFRMREMDKNLRTKIGLAPNVHTTDSNQKSCAANLEPLLDSSSCNQKG